MSYLKSLINEAASYDAQLSSALDDIQNAIIFSGFNEYLEPIVEMHNGEIQLLYLGRIMSEDEIIQRMEDEGYITPNDF